MISIHRLTQEAYFSHLSDEQRHDTLCVAFRVLCEAFPKRKMRRQMYLVWETCEQLIHHIEAVQDKYEELKPMGLNVQDPAFDTLLADASWYVRLFRESQEKCRPCLLTSLRCRFCGETCSLQLGEKLGKRAAENCADKDSLIYAYLCESVATIDHRRGRYGDAYTFFLRSLSIREKAPSTTAPALADAYSAVGPALFGLFQSEESIRFVNKALGIAYAAPEEIQHTFNIDRFLRNRSRPQAALRNFESAKKDVVAAEAFQTKVYGLNSHFHGE